MLGWGPLAGALQLIRITLIRPTDWTGSRGARRYTYLAAIGTNEGVPMQLKVVVHEAEEGGFWAEVPAIPGCATQAETYDELLDNVREAIEGCLAVEVAPVQSGKHDRVIDIAV